jgi:glutamine---fructose-6-phosphate transaminase (isomerizing)
MTSLMHAELHEQPNALQRLIGDAAQSPLRNDIERACAMLRTARHIVLVGCGSSYHAAHVAAQALREKANIAATARVASEVVSDPWLLVHASHVICVSQSGHTADTLEAMSVARARNLPLVAVLADGTSPMAQAADLALVTRSGPERAVPSTKGFTCQLATLWLLTLGLCENTDASAMETLPHLAADTLACEDAIAQVASRIASAESHVFLGTGVGYGIALEGALKMKESARIPAQAYPTFEVRHGPLAALGQNTPALLWYDGSARVDATVALATQLRQCGVPVILFAPRSATAPFAQVADTVVALPDARNFVAPIAGAIAFQLLALHAAKALGRDMDAPPNLVKSVI